MGGVIISEDFPIYFLRIFVIELLVFGYGFLICLVVYSVVILWAFFLAFRAKSAIHESYGKGGFGGGDIVL